MGIDLYFKDESSYLIGSLKYCLACLLFLYVLINGWLCVGCPVIEVFSGFIVIFEVYRMKMPGETGHSRLPYANGVFEMISTQ